MSEISKKARCIIVLLGSLVMCGAASNLAADQPLEGPTADGLTVIELSAASWARQQGVAVGDLLLNWRRGESPKPFTFFLDPALVEMDEAPFGPVTLTLVRQGEIRTVTLGSVPWGLKVAPRLSGEFEVGLRKALELARAARDEEAGSVLRDLREQARQAQRPELVLFFEYQTGDTLLAGRKYKDAAGAYGQAIEDLRTAQGRERALAWLLDEKGKALVSALDFDGAEEAFAEALEIRRRSVGESLAVAASFAQLGRVKLIREKSKEAEDWFRKALDVRNRLAPHSFVAAVSTGHLGNLFYGRGAYDEALIWWGKALQMEQELAPGSVYVTSLLTNLANIHRNRGDLAQSEELSLRAIAVEEKILPDSAQLANSLHNLSFVVRERGDLARAEELSARALAIRRRISPESADVANSLHQLARILMLRGDYDGAEEIQRQALAIREKTTPWSKGTALSTEMLGEILFRRGDLDGASAWFERTLVIREKAKAPAHEISWCLGNIGSTAFAKEDWEKALKMYSAALQLAEESAPGGTVTADACLNMASVHRKMNAHVKAEEFQRRALAIQEKMAPKGLGAALCWLGLGEILLDRGDLPGAEADFGRALEIQQRLAPGTFEEASSHHGLGIVYWRSKRLAEAARELGAAVGAMESQRARLGGSEEARLPVEKTIRQFYQDYMNVLLELGEKGAAFGVLERSRARGLLRLIAERDLILADAPTQLERRRRLAEGDYDRALTELTQVGQGDDETKMAAALDKLREIRQRLGDIAREIRQASPRLASLRYPQPLDVQGARDALDHGTLLLSYSTSAAGTHLFVLQPRRLIDPSAPDLQVFALPVGAEELRMRIDRFRRKIRATLSGPDESLLDQSRRLFDLLVGPAVPLVAKARRVLIVPDGALHVLPFGALVRRTGDRPEFLGAWKPLHKVVSVTVYAGLRQDRLRTPGADGTLVAFGDPAYPRPGGDSPVSPEVQSLVSRYRLDPLPATRQEAERIVALYGRGAKAFLGPQATEEAVKALPDGLRYLHFASHAIVNPAFPLDSALALSLPSNLEAGRENGLLQAWEIFERVRIRADLVALSACETGLGADLGGEGLIGLTRAFQYAGGRSVLASLWKVEDQSTALLMSRFYQHLRSGLPKDEALRRAEAAQSRDPRFASPYFWAAFELIGDWR